MSGSPTFERLTEAALEEHRQIHFYLDQITLSLENLREGLADAEPMRRLGAQLQSLRERIGEHQQAEEQGGLFLAALDILPQARQELRQLRLQHQRIIEILEMARIHAQYGDPSEAPALRKDLLHFLELMREHERAEEALLERAIEQESTRQE